MNTNKEHNILTTLNKDLFKNKTLLLTGGTSQMLYKIAYDFLILGGKVALISRKEEELKVVSEKLVKETETSIDNVKYYVLNLKQPEKYEEILDKIILQYGSIDYLVNGAAGNFLSFAEDLSYNGFKTVLEIDTLSTFYMSKLVFSKFMKKNGGNIVNISANLHHLGTLMNSHASAAKAGVDAITKTLALEFGPYKVRVNGVCPGFIEGTEGFKRLSDPDANKENQYKSSKNDGNLMENAVKYIPLMRFGNRSDVSNVVLFLFSDMSSYITAQTIEVDGGQKNIIPNFIVLNEKFQEIWKKKAKF